MYVCVLPICTYVSVYIRMLLCMYPRINEFICAGMHKVVVWMPVCMNEWMDGWMYICMMSVCLSVRPSVCLSVCLSVGLSKCMSVCLSVRMHVCLYVRMYTCCINSGMHVQTVVHVGI